MFGMILNHTVGKHAESPRRKAADGERGDDGGQGVAAVSILVSFAAVRGCPQRNGPGRSARSQTRLTRREHTPTDLENVRGSSRSRPARERPSDKVSDNRHEQRWTPADTHGRSVPGQGYCGAGSPRLYLASGRRGQVWDCRPPTASDFTWTGIGTPRIVQVSPSNVKGTRARGRVRGRRYPGVAGPRRC